MRDDEILNQGRGFGEKGEGKIEVIIYKNIKRCYFRKNMKEIRVLQEISNKLQKVDVLGLVTTRII